MRHITLVDGWYNLKFPYDDEIKLFLADRRLRYRQDRWWDGERGVWLLRQQPITDEMVAHLRDQYGFQVSAEVEPLLPPPPIPPKVKVDVTDFSLPPTWGERQPYSFQIEAACAFRQQRHLYLADDMGIGKTLSSLLGAELVGAERVLVVTTASAKFNWLREIEICLPSASCQVVSGRKPQMLGARFVVINWDLLAYWKQSIISWSPTCVIFDEAHKAKGESTARTRAAIEVSKGREYVFLLSGTPQKSRPVELVPQLEILGKLGEFGGPRQFKILYCEYHLQTFPGKNGKVKQAYVANGARNLSHLNAKLYNSGIMLRRTKAEVLPELPEKRRVIVPVEISNRKEYDWAEQKFLDWLASTEGEDAAERASEAEQLVQVGKLRRLVIEGKMDAIYEWIGDFLESDESLVAFAHHRDVVQRVGEKFGAGIIQGGTAPQKRQEIVERFQAKTLQMVAGSILACAEAITLTAASNEAFLELPWTPADCDQAEDRCLRIGQENAVTCFYLLAPDTIDMTMLDLLDLKREVNQSTIDGGARTGSGKSIQQQVIEQYRRRVA